MRACANCGFENRPGVFFCENCGASLIAKTSRDTNSLHTGAANAAAAPSAAPSATADTPVDGRSVVREGDKLKLEIEGSPEPITLSATQEIIFGRRDPATGALPDVDLTPHAGYRMGVSRRHAAIRRGTASTLDLWDLGSSNGTFLNGQRLSAHRPYRLRDRDELRLGQMIIRVHFEPAAEAARITPRPGESTAAPGPALEAPAQKEPPSTEPIFALIGMLRDQDAAAESGAVPITEPLPDAIEAPPAEPAPQTASEKTAESVPAIEAEPKPAAEESAAEKPQEPAADKVATIETTPAAPAAPPEAPAPASEPPGPTSAPRAALTPPAPLPKSSNGPNAGLKTAPDAAPIFPTGEAPRNGQTSSAEPVSATPATPETRAEAAPPAPSASGDTPTADAPTADEKPPDAAATPKPSTPPAPTE